MSKYLQAGELFRQREQIAIQKGQLDRRYHNGSSEVKHQLASQVSELMQAGNDVTSQLHGLGFKVRINKSGQRHEVYQLLDDGEEVSSFEVQRF